MDQITAQFNWHSIVLSIAFIQGLFLSAAIIIIKGGKDKAYVFLGLTFFSYSLLVLDDIIFSIGLLKKWPFLINTFSLFIFVVAPTFFLYVRSVINPEVKLRWRDMLHYIPFVLLVIISVPEYFKSHEELLDMVMPMYNKDAFYFNPTVIIPLLQITIYMIVILVKIHRHDLRIKDEYSSTKSLSLSWFRYVLGLILVLWLGWLLSYFLKWKNGMVALDLGYTLFIYLFAYYGWRQPTVPGPLRPLNDKPEISSSVPPGKYLKSGLSPEQKQEIKEKLENYMKKEEPFLDPDLTLSALAAQIDISANYLSQVINEELGKNFYEFINALRIKKAMLMLQEPESRDEKILTIAFNVGFNSKSAFNASFKKMTDMTPRDYRNGQISTSTKSN